MPTLRDQCITEAKKVAKARDKYTCQLHAHEVISGFNCHGSHVFTVASDSRLACDPKNIKTLCKAAHEWWHANPDEAKRWFASKFPDRWAYLQEQFRLNQKKGSIGKLWYKEQLKKLRSELAAFDQ